MPPTRRKRTLTAKAKAALVEKAAGTSPPVALALLGAPPPKLPPPESPPLESPPSEALPPEAPLLEASPPQIYPAEAPPQPHCAQQVPRAEHEPRAEHGDLEASIDPVYTSPTPNREAALPAAPGRSITATPGPPSKGNAARWSVEQEVALLETLVEAIRAGMQGHQGFRDQVWEKVSREVNNASGRVKWDNKQCKSKLDTMKSVWRDWKAHLNGTSGWASDPNLNAPVHDDKAVEDDYFKAHKARRRFRVKTTNGRKTGGIAYRELLEVVLGDRVATGENAYTVKELLNDAVYDSGEEEASGGGEAGQEKEIEWSTTPEPSRVRPLIERASTAPSSASRSSSRASTIPVPPPELTLRQRALKRTIDEASNTSSRPTKKVPKHVEMTAAVQEMASKTGELADAVKLVGQRKPTSLELAIGILSGSEFTSLSDEQHLMLVDSLAIGNNAVIFTTLSPALRASWARRNLGLSLLSHSSNGTFPGEPGYSGGGIDNLGDDILIEEGFSVE